MKQGDYAIIAHDTSLHGIPIGTKIQLLSVTDDDFKVFYDGKFRWINEEDVAEPSEEPVNKDHLKKSIPQLLWNLIVELWTLFLLIIARWFMHWSTSIVEHITYRKTKLKKTKKVVGVLCPFQSQFQFFLRYNKQDDVMYVQIGNGTTFTGMFFDEIIKGPQWWVLPDEQINIVKSRLRKKYDQKVKT